MATKTVSIREKLEKQAASLNGTATGGVADYSSFDLLNTPEFRDAVDRKRAADLKKKEAEAELEMVKEEIEAYMTAVDQIKVGYNGLLVERRTGGTASVISSTKLLEKGVSVDIIEAATIPGKSYTYIQITDPQAASTKRAEQAIARKAAGGRG